jgi:hypothetical protein
MHPTTIPDPTEDAAVFFTLPAVSLEPGMSTADGQDVLDATQTDRQVIFHVYTPADDQAEDARRQAAPETRACSLHARVGMGDFGNTANPGRRHPDALVQLTVSTVELRPGDLLAMDGTPRRPRVVEVAEADGSDPELGRRLVVCLSDGDRLDANEHSRSGVLRPSGQIEEVLPGDLVEGDYYRNHDGEPFFDVEDVVVGWEGDPDVVAVLSSNGNQATYDRSALVQRWLPYDDAAA